MKIKEIVEAQDDFDPAEARELIEHLFNSTLENINYSLNYKNLGGQVFVPSFYNNQIILLRGDVDFFEKYVHGLEMQIHSRHLTAHPDSQFIINNSDKLINELKLKMKDV